MGTCLPSNIFYILLREDSKKLTEKEKNQYHEENSIAAEMVLVDSKIMPKTHKELKDWVIEKSKEKDY